MYFDYRFEPRGDYLCIDCKSFYGSVECVERGLNPLTTMLVVLSGSDRPGGLVLAATPAAKKELGISNVTRKYELPDHKDLICVPPRMNLYIETNLKIVNIIRRYVSDDDIHVYSIDELFVRFDKVKHLYGDCSAKQFANILMQRILEETGIYTTVGIGDNMLLSKLALDNAAKKNPDMIAEWRYEDVPSTVWKIKSLTDFWGIGHRTAKNLWKRGITTVEELAKTPPSRLKASMGVIGLQLHAHANGIDRSEIDKKYKVLENSISNSQILMKDYTDKKEVMIIIREMADLVGSRLRKEHAQTESIALSIGYSHGELLPGFSRQMKVPATSNTKQITSYLLQLFEEHYAGYAVRHVGVSCSKLVYQTSLQLDLFSDPEKTIQQEKLDFLCDEIRSRYGFKALIHASSLLPGATAVSRSAKVGGH